MSDIDEMVHERWSHEGTKLELEQALKYIGELEKQVAKLSHDLECMEREYER